MIDDLYQEVILDHNKNPRNFGKINAPHKEGFNPLCGDKVKVFADIKDDHIVDISFEGEGCAISKASASMMTQILKGKTTYEANTLFEEFHDLVTQKKKGKHLDNLEIFASIANYPTRTKCATLCWHALHNLINQE